MWKRMEGNQLERKQEELWQCEIEGKHKKKNQGKHEKSNKTEKHKSKSENGTR